ncbi:unnamed protein product [Soboliphyme baturini]|uniref:40S ribosomal protein S25 n=1 Tax=Soboliphyme baturini TaxID=241478 RepID=A0A183IGW5_9BILA|nr:unnamed protein product [Soboliphyme baturini]
MVRLRRGSLRNGCYIERRQQALKLPNFRMKRTRITRKWTAAGVDEEVQALKVHQFLPPQGSRFLLRDEDASLPGETFSDFKDYQPNSVLS